MLCMLCRSNLDIFRRPKQIVRTFAIITSSRGGKFKFIHDKISELRNILLWYFDRGGNKNWR